jgi:hypothetical protein
MNKLARLSMLLPAAMGLSMAASSAAHAYQLGAGEYAAKIAAALAAGQFADASLSVERLRGCGVSSIVVDGRSTTMEEIAAAGAGGQLSDALSGNNASFVVGSISSGSVDCDVPPEDAQTAVAETQKSLTNGESIPNPSST